MSGRHSGNQNDPSDSRVVLRALIIFGVIWAFSTTFVLGYMIA